MSDQSWLGTDDWPRVNAPHHHGQAPRNSGSGRHGVGTDLQHEPASARTLQSQARATGDAHRPTPYSSTSHTWGQGPQFAGGGPEHQLRLLRPESQQQQLRLMTHPAGIPLPASPDPSLLPLPRHLRGPQPEQVRRDAGGWRPRGVYNPAAAAAARAVTTAQPTPPLPPPPARLLPPPRPPSSVWEGGGPRARTSPHSRRPDGSSSSRYEEALAAWPGSEWLSNEAGPGVRIKGFRLSRMMDGVQAVAGGVPHMFRVYSTSGQAEWWPVDAAAVLCGCPNDSALCSHLYGIAVSYPRYRAKLALLVKARGLLQAAARQQAPLDPIVTQLAAGLHAYLTRSRAAERGPPPTVADACLVACDTLMAALLQQHIMDYGATRAWWRGMAVGPGTRPPATAPEAVAQAVCHAAQSCVSELVGDEDSNSRQQLHAARSCLATLQHIQAAVAEALGWEGSSQEELGPFPGSGSSGQKRVSFLTYLADTADQAVRDAVEAALMAALNPPGHDRQQQQQQQQAAEPGVGGATVSEQTGAEPTGGHGDSAAPRAAPSPDGEDRLLLSSYGLSSEQLREFTLQAAGAASEGQAPPGHTAAAAVAVAACKQFGLHGETDAAARLEPLIRDFLNGPDAATAARGPWFAEALLLGTEPAQAAPVSFPTDGLGGPKQQRILVVLPVPTDPPTIALDVAHSSVDSIAAAVEALDGVKAAGALLSLAVVHGGVGQLPAELLATAVQRSLTRALHGQDSRAAAQYVMDVALSLPAPFNGCRELAGLLLPRQLLAFGAPGQESSSSRSLPQAVTQLVAGLPGAALKQTAWTALKLLGSCLEVPAWQGPVPGASQAAHPLPIPEPAAAGPAGPGSASTPATATVHPAPPVNPALGRTTAVEAVPDATTPPGHDAAHVKRPAGLPSVLTPDAARAVIEDIRRREFGIGVTMPPEARRVLDAQHARLRRALHRLSIDLYSHNVHLLLELLQNADDCEFELPACSEDVPTLGLWVGPHGLAVACNERGFREADVRALADVGASSKVTDPAAESDGTRGKTGEKGIGFKSVFAVSDTPHVASGGFVFGFDAADPSGIGMVVPRWLGGDDASDDRSSRPSRWGAPDEWPCPPAEAVGGRPSQWNTCIWLPAADRLLGAAGEGAAAPHSWSHIARELVAGVQPSLLLFLRRIRRLVLYDAATSATHVFHRADKVDATGVMYTEVTHTTQQDGSTAPPVSRTHRWLRTRHPLLSPPVPRRGVTLNVTDICIALPLPDRPAHARAGLEETADEDARSNGAAGLPPQVYAFLPVRSFGLPFALHADWLLPASREDVLAGQAWNQALREAVPAAFAAAIAACTHCPELCTRWLDYLPSSASAQGFFRPLASSIPAVLRDLACVPTLGGELAPPMHVLIADKAVTDLVPEQELSRALGMKFAHPEFSERAVRGSNGQVHALLHLGAQHFSAHHLVAVLEAVGVAGLPNCTTAGGVWRLLALADHLLAQEAPVSGRPAQPALKAATAVTHRLARLPVVPLVGCGWAAPGPSLFLTPQLHTLLAVLEEEGEEGEEGEETVKGSAAVDPVDTAADISLSGLVHDQGALPAGLQVVDVSGLLSRSLDAGARRAAAHMLTAVLHVRPSTPADVIERHVLPTLRQAGQSGGSEAVQTLVSCAAYLMGCQALAVADPTTAQQWRDALSWVVVHPNPQAPLNGSQPLGDEAGWHVIVPSSQGVLLGLTLPPCTDMEYDDGAGRASPCWTLPAALHAAMRAALHDVPCCLHPAYFAVASADSWATFIGSTLRCGFTLCRPLLARAPSAAATAPGQSARAVDGGQAWGSPDLQAVLDWFDGHGSGVGVEEGGSDQQLQALTQVWEALDVVWAAELLPAAAAAAGIAASSVVDPSAPPLDGCASAADALRRCRCMPVRALRLPNEGDGNKTFGAVALVSPADGPWAAPNPAVTDLLGSAATVIVHPRLQNQGLRRVLGVQDAPSCALILRQLHAWSSTMPPDARPPQPSIATLASMYGFLAASCPGQGGGMNAEQTGATSTEDMTLAAMLAGLLAGDGPFSADGDKDAPAGLRRTLWAAFQVHALIALPPPCDVQQHEPGLRWIALKGGPGNAAPLCWEHPPGALLAGVAGLPPALASLYPPHLRTFFVHTLGVPERPGHQELLIALRRARQEDDAAGAWCMVHAAAAALFDADACPGADDGLVLWSAALRQEAILPAVAREGTHKVHWVSAEDPGCFVCWPGSPDKAGPGGAELLHRVLAAAEASGARLHVLRPDVPGTADMMPSGTSDRTRPLKRLMHAVLRLPLLSDHVTLQLEDGRGAQIGAGRPPAHTPALNIISVLNEALPVVARYLWARRPEMLQSDKFSGVAGLLRQVHIVAVPGLRLGYRLDALGLITKAEPTEAVLVLGRASQRPLLAVTSSGHNQPPWRAVWQEFARLFSFPPGSPNTELAGLLLVHHSLAGQPAEQVDSVMAAMCQLPPFPATPSDAEMLRAVSEQWAVRGHVEEGPPGQEGGAGSNGTTPFVRYLPEGAVAPGGAAQRGPEEEDVEEGEEIILWRGRTSGTIAEQPCSANDEVDASACSHHPDHGPFAPEDRTRVDPPGLESFAGELAAGMPHGFERPTNPNGGHGQRRGPEHALLDAPTTGDFHADEIQVPDGVRRSVAPFAQAPESSRTARREAVGRWGEQLVAGMLRDDPAHAGHGIEWLNEDKEQGLPYDVVVRAADGSVLLYVEVKATASAAKTFFEVSHREWLFAQQEGARYAMYRVEGAGTDRPTVKIINNPYLQWRSQRVGVCLAL